MSNHRKSLRSEPEALVIFPGALGDLVCLLPALEVIATRVGSPPAILCRDSLAPLLRVCGVAEPRSLDGPEGAWLFSGDPPEEASTAFGRFTMIECFTGAGIPEVERNLFRWAGDRARVHSFRPAANEHAARHYLRCVGAEPGRLPTVRLAVPPAIVDRARRWIDPAGSVLVIHPGSGGMRKRWSRAGFIEIAAWWRREQGHAVFVLGPAERGERALWEEKGGVEPLEPDLVELAAILASCDAYLGNDSGASHLAAAVGARGLSLFGPTDPEQWRPLAPGLRACRLPKWSESAEDAPPEMLRTVERELARALTESSP